jgi:hypothetical protein
MRLVLLALGLRVPPWLSTKAIRKKALGRLATTRFAGVSVQFVLFDQPDHPIIVLYGTLPSNSTLESRLCPSEGHPLHGLDPFRRIFGL